MFKKLVPFLALACFAVGLPFSAMATHANTKKMNNRLFLDVSESAYYLNPPEFGAGTIGNSNTYLATIRNNGYTPLTRIGLGYQFYNSSNNIFTKLFGHENAVEFKFGYFDTEKRVQNQGQGLGKVWLINGSGNILTSLVEVVGENLSTKNRYNNFTIAYKGAVEAGNPYIIFKPFFGLRSTNFDTDTNLILSYSGSSYIFIPYTDKEHYELTTHYIGLTIGGDLNFIVNNRTSFLFGINLNVLHAKTYLDADQNACIEFTRDTRYTAKLHDSQEKDFTYRAILSLGVNSKFWARPDSPYFSLRGGVDYWSYVPTIITPMSANGGPVHLDEDSMTNGFVDLGIHIPF